jgi:hypothetical protein
MDRLTLLTYARIGAQKALADIEAMLGENGAVSKSPKPQGVPGTHVISAEGRERIAAAQRKRWALKRRLQGKRA